MLKISKKEQGGAILHWKVSITQIYSNYQTALIQKANVAKHFLNGAGHQVFVVQTALVKDIFF